jgi:hypothetical protein
MDQMARGADWFPKSYPSSVEAEVVEIEAEPAMHDVVENDVCYFLDHQTSAFLQVGAVMRRAGVPVLAGAGWKVDGAASRVQTSEAEADEGGVDRQAEQAEEALPEVHMVEGKRLLLGKGCMAALAEADVVELQQVGDTGGVAAVSASYFDFRNHSLHRVHSVLLRVVRVEMLATAHCKAQTVGHVAVVLLLQPTTPSNLADLAEEEADQEATGAAEAYNLGLAEKDFCSLLWRN